MKYYLSLLLLALAGPLAAQTTPPASPPPPGSANWYIYNQPLQEKAHVPETTEAAALRSYGRRAVRQTQAPFQGSLYVPLDPNTYRLLDRYAIKYGSDSLRDPHTSVRPYTRAAAAHLGERLLGEDAPTGTDEAALLNASRPVLSRADLFNAQYLLKDNWMYAAQGDSLNRSQQPFLSYFYRNQTDLYHVQAKDFSFRLNPVLLLQAGKDGGENSRSGLRYVNTRGISFEGLIDQRLGFYGFLTDNQEAVPGWVYQRGLRDNGLVPVAPHEGYTKYFKDKIDQYDFFTARGGITYAATKHINVQFAHDRNFIGNGYRSLILSDYSAPYFFLKLNTRVWKFNYQNIFAELNARRSISGLDSLYPKKYLALHHLSLDVTNNFNIGVFESEVSGGRGRGLELQYLNPIIFYRAIEQNVGSTDNALLGLDFKWNVKHRAQLYGQLVLDEFKLSEITAGKGWWANKQAVQLGGKYLDVAGVPNLDLQLELNYIRPFTYQHENEYTNYQHYQQPLAHPMGANLTELLGVLSYQPLPRLNLVAKLFYTVQGVDSLATTRTAFNNYGSNVLLSYNTRIAGNGIDADHGMRTGQGDKNRLVHFDFTATYQPRLNLFVDATLIARHSSLTQPTYYGAVSGTEVYASLALRWNIAQRLHEF